MPVLFVCVCVHLWLMCTLNTVLVPRERTLVGREGRVSEAERGVRKTGGMQSGVRAKEEEENGGRRCVSAKEGKEKKRITMCERKGWQDFHSAHASFIYPKCVVPFLFVFFQCWGGGCFSFGEWGSFVLRRSSLPALHPSTLLPRPFFTSGTQEQQQQQGFPVRQGGGGTWRNCERQLCSVRDRWSGGGRGGGSA